ncbi:MAG: tryptophan 2,3-dioxygenase [Sphingomonadaceae bacterium]
MTATPAAMTYVDYLDLERLLSAQHPLSDLHDEMLFIILHQTKELWLKQILYELDEAVGLLRADRVIEVHKGLSRISRIQAVMTLSWEVLATMTPVDYVRFRQLLGTSSGFQSAQFRAMEYRLGLKDPAYLENHRQGSQERGLLERMLAAPSLWDEANAALGRAGFTLPPGNGERASAGSHEPDPQIEAAWAQVYMEPERWWPFYQLAEKLVDIDDALANWRHKHVVTVERIIGTKRGTGGTSGAAYLRSTLEKRAFPELWALRTSL